VRVEIEMFGDTLISRSFDRMIDAASDLRPAWEEMADDFARVENQRFAQQGPGWAPLSADYAARKRPAGPILQRTRRLKDSLTARPFPIENLGPLEAGFGSDVEYGVYHQQGTPKMPKREVVKLTNADRARWMKYAQRHLFGRGS
jgi:phage gpG-like protein